MVLYLLNAKRFYQHRVWVIFRKYWLCATNKIFLGNLLDINQWIPSSDWFRDSLNPALKWQIHAFNRARQHLQDTLLCHKMDENPHEIFENSHEISENFQLLRTGTPPPGRVEWSVLRFWRWSRKMFLPRLCRPGIQWTRSWRTCSTKGEVGC